MPTAPAKATPAYLHQLIERMAVDRPNAAAVVHGGWRLRYARLNDLANRLANHLRGLGVGPGTRAALCFEPGPEHVMAQLAIVKLGATAVLLDPGNPESRLAFLLDATLARALVTSRRGLDRVALDRRFPVVLLDDDAWRSASPAAPDVRVSDDTICQITYTHGPTTLPRAVLRTHGQLRTAARFGPPPSPRPLDYLLTLAAGGTVEPATGRARRSTSPGSPS
ncbi:MAG TPA: AMP-binding protein [Actinophytocola sp.]|jgi:non-ribosomal peptide synthetase component F|uniref:AMP-binding protein n=1 Tax=Actinophytocola sp. TaxID=1872138 RepID=UPI002DFE8619|nr:AMP-binding protein [Actinophytocola sp.]